MNDVTIIDRFLNTFSTYIDSGFGLLQGEVAFLTATLIVIDMTIAGLYWAMSHATGQGDDVIAKLLRKVLYVGAFAYIIGNFNALASILFRSFAGLGLTATGSTLTMENFLQPGRLAKVGIDAGAPILAQIGDMTGFPEVFVNLDPIVVMFLAWLVVVLCFFVLAIQLFITLIEFKLTTLAGFVLVPFALWNKTAFLTEKVLGNVVSSGIKVLVLAVIVGIGSGLFAEFQVHPAEPSIDHALVIMLASLTLLALGIFGPGIATGLVSGAPQLGEREPVDELHHEEELPVVAEDQDLAACRPSDGAAVLKPFHSVELGRAEAFGSAVHFPDALRAQPVDPELLEPGRDRRRRVPDRFERGHVPRLVELVGQPGDAVHHRRHQADPLHTVAFDQRQEFLGIEPGHADNRSPVKHHHMRHGEGEVVIERGGVQHHAVPGHAQPAHGIVHTRRVMVDDQLGPPGRSARRHGLPARCLDAREWRIFRMVAAEVCGQGAKRCLQVGIGDDDRSGLGQFEDRVQLGRRQARGHDCRRRAQFPDRESQLVECVAVGQGKHDAIAPGHSQAGKGMGAAQRAFGQFAPADRIVAVAQGPAVGPKPIRVALGHVSQQDFGHPFSPWPFLCRGPPQARPPGACARYREAW